MCLHDLASLFGVLQHPVRNAWRTAAQPPCYDNEQGKSRQKPGEYALRIGNNRIARIVTSGDRNRWHCAGKVVDDWQDFTWTGRTSDIRLCLVAKFDFSIM